MDSNPELDEKIKEWAKTDPMCSQYMSNMVLLRRMYVKHHMAERVKDVIVDGGARLTLAITKENRRRPTKLCSECKAKKCKESCGAEDYIDMQGRSYVGTDVFYQGDDVSEANIFINVPPFHQDRFEHLESDAIYVIEGLIRANDFNGKRYVELAPEKIERLDSQGSESQDSESQPSEPVDASKVDRAAKSASELINLSKDGAVGINPWNAVMGSYGQEVLAQVMEKLGLVKEGEGDDARIRRKG